VFSTIGLFFGVFAFPAHDDDTQKNDRQQGTYQTNDLTAIHDWFSFFLSRFSVFSNCFHANRELQNSSSQTVQSAEPPIFSRSQTQLPKLPTSSASARGQL
jgi:hypothetical protein